MMLQALDEFQSQNDVTLEKVTKIPLEGEGTIDRRVEKCVSAFDFIVDFIVQII